MRPCRWCVRFLGIVVAGALGFWFATDAAMAQTGAYPTTGAPAFTPLPPQQMPAYGSPIVTPYPSTGYDDFRAGEIGSTDAVVSNRLASYENMVTVGVTPADSAPPTDSTGGYDTPSPSLYQLYSGPDAMTAAPSTPGYAEPVSVYDGSQETWGWQLLPNGLVYPTYLAGGREPRLGSQFVHDYRQGWLWDISIGARVGLLRFGSDNAIRPQGWQLDVEAAAFPRLDLRADRDLVSIDFRAGMPLTYRQGPWETKLGYDHYCSHLGDEYMLKHLGTRRLNYVRDSIVWGVGYYINPSLRLYAESSWAFCVDGGAEPWQFQFGVDFASPDPTGPCGSPFFAVNGCLREENDFGGNLTVQTGWQWRGRSGKLFRLGMHYFNGMSDQRQFFDVFEEQLGFGVWYDF